VVLVPFVPLVLSLRADFEYFGTRFAA